MLNAMFQRIQGLSPTAPPTDMGVNMRLAIVDDELAGRPAAWRSCAGTLCRHGGWVRGKADDSVVRKLEIVMQQADVTPDICPAVAASLQVAESTGMPAGAMKVAGRPHRHRQEQLLLGPSAARF